MGTTIPVFGHYGGYRKMLSYQWTCLVYHATKLFCARNFTYKNDSLGKAAGQMNGAARSARQNIIEASSRAATSKEQELRQLDVAKGSLDELAGDYEAFLIDCDQAPWSMNDPSYQAVRSLELAPFSGSSDMDHDFGVYILAMRARCAEWLQNEDPVIAANSLLIAIRRATALLMGQMRRTAEDFRREGGFREHLTRARLAYRDRPEDGAARGEGPGAPACPKCGKPMRQVVAKKGPNAGQAFWGCPGYPECSGTRPL